MKTISLVLLVVLSVAVQQAFAYEQTIYIPRSKTIYSQQYNFSEKNISALTTLKNAGVRLKVGKFTPAVSDDGSIMCRGWFPIAPGRGVSFSEFVKAALTSELVEAGIYSESGGTELSLQVETIDFDSFGSGKWKFRMSIAADKKDSVIVVHNHPFEIPFTAAAACQAVGNAFVPGVQEFLFAIYSDPEFLGFFEK